MEKRRQVGQAKVTKGNPHAHEVRENQVKVKGGLKRQIEAHMCGSSNRWGGRNFRFAVEAKISTAGGRRSATGRDLTGFDKIRVSKSSKEVGLGLGGF